MTIAEHDISQATKKTALEAEYKLAIASNRKLAAQNAGIIEANHLLVSMQDKLQREIGALETKLYSTEEDLLVTRETLCGVAFENKQLTSELSELKQALKARQDSMEGKS